eukprot:2793053-Prymnesium_polylepis.1
MPSSIGAAPRAPPHRRRVGERTGVGAAAEWRHRLVCAAHRPAGGPVHRAAGSAAHQQRRSGRRAGLRRCGAGVRVG